MITPMLRPDLFGGLATHAGDALFEACYQPEFAECARALRDHYDGSYDAFWADFRSRPPMSKPDDGALLNEWAMAACYSADADGTIRLPFDPLTSELVPEVWARWLRWDPVRMARTPEGAAALRSMRAIWIDAGTRDEYFLDLGAEAFRRECVAAGAPEIRFELFDAKHGAHRVPLPARDRLARGAPGRLSGAAARARWSAAAAAPAARVSSRMSHQATVLEQDRCPGGASAGPIPCSARGRRPALIVHKSRSTTRWCKTGRRDAARTLLTLADPATYYPPTTEEPYQEWRRDRPVEATTTYRRRRRQGANSGQVRLRDKGLP